MAVNRFLSGWGDTPWSPNFSLNFGVARQGAMETLEFVAALVFPAHVFRSHNRFRVDQGSTECLHTEVHGARLHEIPNAHRDLKSRSFALNGTECARPSGPKRRQIRHRQDIRRLVVCSPLLRARMPSPRVPKFMGSKTKPHYA